MSIEERYVSFKTARLLKNKGFDELVNNYYSSTYPVPYRCWMVEHGWESRYVSLAERFNSRGEGYLAKPTHQFVVDYLREKFNLIITVDICISNYKYYYYIYNYKTGYKYSSEFAEQYWQKYKDATEESIVYCLENLI